MTLMGLPDARLSYEFGVHVDYRRRLIGVFGELDSATASLLNDAADKLQSAGRGLERLAALLLPESQTVQPESVS
jgi:NH3-dependent NAD+ synthetase